MKVSNIRPENKDLRGRVHNWKFSSALLHLDGEAEDVQITVQTLATMFGNVGWFEGTMATMVERAVNSLLQEEP